MSERRAADGRSDPDQRPPAPWGKAPLAELAIFAGIICLAIGVFGSHETMIGVGVGLAAVGGMEVAIREHFAGYRSHTTLFAGFVFVVVVGALYYGAGGRSSAFGTRPRAARVSGIPTRP